MKNKKNILQLLKISMMTFCMSFISTFRNYWFKDGFTINWIHNWWITLIFVIPIVYIAIDPFINFLWKKYFTN